LSGLLSMSRIGSQSIEIPEGVSVEQRADLITVTGPKIALKQAVPENVSIKIENNQIYVRRANGEKKSRANQGLLRSLINNMVTGVTEGFKKQLEVEGVGFKVSLSGNTLKLALGYSHETVYVVPDELNVGVNGNLITIEGASKQLVGQAAAEIRALRKPEPYKGKGIHYVGEQILRKAGKAAAGVEEQT